MQINENLGQQPAGARARRVQLPENYDHAADATPSRPDTRTRQATADKARDRARQPRRFGAGF